ncbi:MAG: MFS transporter [Pseudomonadota bacterium]
MSLRHQLLQRYPAFAAPLYRRYWLASLGSVGGWQIANMAMGWQVFELTASELDLGVLGAATAIPAIAMTLFGGVIADRFDKRRVLLLTTAGNLAVLASLALCALAGVLNVWLLWSAAALISALSGIDWPVRQSFFPHLIERSALPSAVALNSVLWQVTRLVLPAFGGVLIALFDHWLPYALASLGYALMLLVVWRMRLELPGDRSLSPWRQTVEGLRFIAQHPLFRTLMLISYATMLFVSAYMQLLPAFIAELDAGATGFGMLMSLTGVGSLAGTLAIGAARIADIDSSAPPAHYMRWLLGAAAAGALLLLGFAAATALGSFALAALTALLAASATSVYLVLSTTAMQAAVPDTLRGRVMGIHGITYSLMPLGALWMGAVAESAGAPSALTLSLGIYLALLAILAPPALRLHAPMRPG